ncbi:BTB/POZ domain-containing protein At5g03250-like [Phragmites australis]|uniref:BTB/POZ domain-containing protein At5g03250-like n=1 Tax=Phragmites australis TaxID=29695 RepID=UPI002D76ECE2|nr:BTB/POZ domain-containing protein At5g03250-like [Phragmites australis]
MATTKVIGSKPSDCFQFQDPNTWICMTELVSDVVVEVGEMSFHLHKFPLISRSGTLQKLINESTGDDDNKPSTVRLDDIPGGPEAFELAARFCYDVRMELNAVNVVPLRCAAEHLQMTEDYGEGNLVEQAESFLRDVLGSWNDAVRALQACDAVLPHAEDLHIVSRCINSLVSKACADPTLFGWPMLEYYTAKSLEETVIWNGISTAGKPRSPGADWWYKQALSFRLPVYKRLITTMRSRGMSPENIAGSLMHYARRHLSGLSRHSGYSDGSRGGASGTTTVLSDNDQRVLLEEVVALLPAEKGVATTRFLLGLLRTATILHAGAACRDALERRAGNQMEEAALEDLLIPNTGYSAETLYDVDCVQRMLEQFMMASTSAFAASPEITDEGQLVDAPSVELMPVTTVAKLVDGYLAEVGTDTNLKLSKFQTIAALVPDYARAIDDGLYRAIDIYLKAHPWLTDSEREHLCRLMNCQKLSLEACTHAAQNERLPLRVMVQVLFFEQLRLRTTVAGWFFVSDNADQGSSSDNCVLSRRSGELDFAAVSEETDEEGFTARHDELSSAMSAEEIRQRVSELEEECSSMRQEIHRLGKPKSALSQLFQKLGLGKRSSSRQRKQQTPQLPPGSSDKRRRSLDLGC